MLMDNYTDNTQGAKKFVRDCLDFDEMDSKIAVQLLEGIFVPLRDVPNVWQVKVDGEVAAQLNLSEQYFELADWIL